MTQDPLRRRLSRSDPAPFWDPVDPATSGRARALREEIMATEVETSPVRGRRWALAGAAAAVLVAVVGGTALIGGSREPAPLALQADGGNAMASCLPFDVETLAGMSPAFAGTVVELTDHVATLRVDRWYTGGDTDVVEITYTPGFEALIGTPTLEVGQRYLITATDGAVNGCGYSGLATPDYEAAFEQAFAG